MFRKAIVSVMVVCGLIASVVSGCGPEDTTSYRDSLNATMLALQADGKTAAANLQLEAYDWIISFTDGSTVAERFTPTPALMTDATGNLAFTSAELSLRSGRLAEYCTDVCVEWGTGYEDVCSYYSTYYEDVCVAWDYDEYGYEYCAQWDTQSYEYCAAWTTESYSYCSAYGEDCSYYYPARRISDIKSTYAAITYRSGTSVVTTESQDVSVPATSLNSTSTLTGHDTLVDTQWNQNDTFVTTLTGLSVRSAVRRVTRPTPGKNPKPTTLMANLGRTHKPALRIPTSQFDTLTAEQLAKLQAARNTCGAYPKELK